MRDIHVVSLLAAVAVFAGMGPLLVRQKLREKYAVLWLVVASVVLVLAALPGLLDGVARRLGVIDPVNLLLFAAVTFLLLVCVHLSWEASRLEDETRVLAEELALLRSDVERGRRADGPMP